MPTVLPEGLFLTETFNQHNIFVTNEFTIRPVLKNSISPQLYQLVLFLLAVVTDRLVVTRCQIEAQGTQGER